MSIPRAVATPEALHAYPAAQIAPIVDAYAHAIHVIFLAAIPVPLVAFVLALFLKQVPLRGTARETAPDVGEGFGMPEGSDANQQLQLAIARLIRHKGRTELPRVRAQSGCSVRRLRRLERGPGLPPGAARPSRRPRGDQPPLPPARGSARARVPTTPSVHGYLHDQDGQFAPHHAGEAEMGKLVAGHAGLARRRARRLGSRRPRARPALGDLATQFVEQDPDLSREPVAALVGGPTR